MSITMTTRVAVDAASYAPIVIVGTSSRDNIRTNGTLVELNILAYADSGGKLQLTVATDGTSFEAGDTVTITGATGDLAQYNGRHEVQGSASSSVTLTTNWNAGTTAAVGKITRANDNLLVRADVYKGATLLGSVYAMPDKRTFRMNLSETFKLGHASIFTLTNGAGSVTGAVYSYEVKMFEQWQKVDYSIVAVETVGEVQTGKAHRVTSVASLATTDYLNTTYTAGGKIVLHFLSQINGVLVKFTPDNGSTTTVGISNADGHYLAVYEIPAGAKFVTIVVRDTDDTTTVKGTLIVRVANQGCGKRLYYLNRLGGYSSVEIVEYEDFDEVQKIDRYAVRTYNIREAKTVIEAKQYSAYLDGLAESQEVYNEAGVQVYLTDNKLKKYGEEVQLLLEIKTEQLSML